MELRDWRTHRPSHLRAFGTGLILAVAAGTAPAQGPGSEGAAGTAQVASSGAQQPPWRSVLQGDDARRVEALEKTIDDLEKQGRFAEALAPAREVLAVRRRAQGDDHWETIDARTKEQACLRVSGLSREAQAELAAASRRRDEAEKLRQGGRYAEIEPLARAIWEVQRRILGEDHHQTIESGMNLAVSLSDQGKYNEADPLLRKGLASFLRIPGEDHPRTAEGYDNLAANLEGLGKFAEAEPLHRKAMAISDRIRGDAHPEMAARYNNLATNLEGQGKYAEAEPLFRRALAIRVRALGEDHPDTGEGYNNLGSNLDVQRKHAEAEPLLGKAWAIARKAFGEEHPRSAATCNNLAMNLNEQGRYTEAEPLYRRALAIRRRILGEDHPETAQGYNNLAYNLDFQERYAEAEPLLHQALAIRLRTVGEDHPLTARSYNNLAYNLSGQGRYAEAEPLDRRALAIRLRTLGEDHPLTARSDNNLANDLLDQGKNAEAEPILRKSLASQRRTLGEENPNTALCYKNLARSLAGQGRYAEAEPLFRKALAIYRRTLGEDHPETASDAIRLAMNLDDQGGHSEAEGLLRKALGACRRALGEDHPGTAWGYNRLAHSQLARGEFAEAEASALAACKSYEATRARISFSGLIRAEDASKFSPAPLAAALLARRGQGLDAWRHWESELARGLFDDLTARRIRPLTPDERLRQDDLIRRLNRLENQIGVLAGARAPTGDQRKRFDELKGRRLEVQGRLAQLEAELVQKHQVAAGAVYPLDRIQARLPADAALVGWLDLKGMPRAADPRGDHWACVVRRAGVPRWIRIAGTGPDGAWTGDDERRPERVQPLLGGEDRPAWREAAAKLAAQRLGPLEDALAARDSLPAVRHLIVLPSPALAGIPIEAMLEARPAGAPRYLVSYAPSGTLFAWLAERRREGRARPRRLLALGDPVPSPSDEPAPRPGLGPDDRPTDAIRLARRAADDTLRRIRGAAFDRLPGSAREVRAIAGLFDQREIYLGSDASEQTLESLRSRGELATFAVIHLATHGEVDDLAPMRSRLLLSQDHLPDPTAAPPDGPVFDGILTAAEVLGTWKLDAELVAVGACRSGLGRPSGGEGHVGFAQAFFLAGARSVIVSLWVVDDRATSLLMTRFYQNWLGKRPGLDRPMSKAEALREAKAWLRGLTGTDVERELDGIARGGLKDRSSRLAADHPFAHPHDWAGFILIGDPD
jgi:CHAT domain-containing protein/tetratricopeptide (TPR) repeat protein